MIEFIFLMIIVTLLFVYVLHKYHTQKTLKKRVSWCVASSNLERYNLSLLEHINSVDADLKYMIVGETEEQIAKYILETYQSKLAQDYFNDKLSISKEVINSRYAQTDEAYFFISLSRFLQEHECEKYFNEKQMYTTKTYKSYGSWGGELFDATYEFTDVGFVYHKLYYLAQLYCEKLGWSSHAETERLEKCLECKEIQVSRF